MQGEVKLREGTRNDALLVMAWRSNPLVYKGFLKQTTPLQYENHIDWWGKQRWKHWIIVYGGGKYQRDVGQINLQNLDSACPEVGYFIGEIPLWGKGIASESVRLVIEWMKVNGYKQVCADVKKDNLPSMTLLKKLGFKGTNNGRDGLQRFLLEW